jgi:hypothetical protein
VVCKKIRLFRTSNKPFEVRFCPSLECVFVRRTYARRSVRVLDRVALVCLIWSSVYLEEGRLSHPSIYIYRSRRGLTSLHIYRSRRHSLLLSQTCEIGSISLYIYGGREEAPSGSSGGRLLDRGNKCGHSPREHAEEPSSGTHAKSLTWIAAPTWIPMNPARTHVRLQHNIAVRARRRYIDQQLWLHDGKEAASSLWR